jgi:hypothetical protein
MGDPILDAATFEVKIGGVAFVLRRRSTEVMALARGFMAVVGQIAADPAAADKVNEKAARDLSESILRAAMVVPMMAAPGETTVTGARYTYHDLAPFADALLTQFMHSGLQVDPTEPSCKASVAVN